MSIYFLQLSKVSRAKGRCATAAAAYVLATKIRDDRTGLNFNYSRKKGVLDAGHLTPKHAKWACNASDLWNTVEAAETRKNSCVARELILALPHELPLAESIALVRDLSQVLVSSYGVALTWAIHSPDKHGDQRNTHAHILFSAREATAEGMGKKVRVLDDIKTGGKEIERIRQEWAALCNQALITQNSPANLDHRSYQRQNKKIIGGVHLGRKATEMQRAGKNFPITEHKKIIKETNMKIESLIEKLDELHRQEADLRAISAQEDDLCMHMIRTIAPTEDTPLNVQFQPTPTDFFNYRAEVRKLYPSATIIRENNGVSLHFGEQNTVRDTGDRLTAAKGSSTEIMALLKLAELKGWKTLHLSGPQPFKRAIWEAALKKGYPPEAITGYTPTEGEIAAALRMRKLLNSVMSQRQAFKPLPKPENPSPFRPR